VDNFTGRTKGKGVHFCTCFQPAFIHPRALVSHRLSHRGCAKVGFVSRDTLAELG